MAREGALPKIFGDIHPRYLTPGFATLAMGAVSVVWYLGLVALADKNVLTDSVAATAIGIAFYYGLTGFACTVFYRRELFKSAKNFICIGVVPTAGGLMMLALLVAACINYSSPDQNKTAFFGIGGALVFALGALVLGLLLMAWARLALPDFFRRQPGVVDPAQVGADTAHRP
jgi:amino acid transporter